MSDDVPAITLHLITRSDERIGKPNQRTKKATMEGAPGLVGGSRKPISNPCFKAHVYRPDELFASMVLGSEEFVRFLRYNCLSVLCESDPNDTSIPEIGQRVPTRDRRKKIREAWADPNRTPSSKHETIEIGLHGAKIDNDGIHLGPGSLALVMDGAGRIQTAIDDVLENEGSILRERGIIWQLNFDLSADITRQAKLFLAHGRDAKRIGRGTTVSVENLLIGKLEESNEFAVPENFEDKLAKTYVLRRLYGEYGISRSLTELFPWNYEGRIAESDEFRGNGRASNIATALSGLIAKQLDRLRIKPKQLPGILDFAFRCWYKHCPTAINDSHRDATETNYKSKYRLHTTLGMKVIILVSLRAYKFAGMKEDAFVTACERIIHKHWEHHKSNGYTNPKTKRIDLDRFWQESVYFADSSRFNSGEVNTVTLLKQLTVAANEVCGPIANPGKAAKKQSKELASKLVQEATDSFLDDILANPGAFGFGTKPPQKG